METEKFQELVLNHLAKLTQDNTEIIQRLDKVESAVVRIENEQGEKVRALFDVREVQLDTNDRLIDSLSRIESKLDRLSLKISSHDVLLKSVR